MSNLLVLLAFCFVAGILLRRARCLPENAPAAISGIVINLSIPAFALVHLHRFVLDPRYLLPVLMPWSLFGLGAFVFRMLGRWLGLTSETSRALMLPGGLGNTACVGQPMIESLCGRAAIALGLLIVFRMPPRRGWRAHSRLSRTIDGRTRVDHYELSEGFGAIIRSPHSTFALMFEADFEPVVPSPAACR